MNGISITNQLMTNSKIRPIKINFYKYLLISQTNAITPNYRLIKND